MVEVRRRPIFPFPAIVGHDKAKLALLIVSVNPAVGGVLLRGDKGTGKSTMVRALADVLPEVKVVSDCIFSCDPDDPRYMCDRCYERYSRGETLPVTYRKMKVIDLPLSISVERLVGTINIEKFLREGIVDFKPGLLAEANRNILYIDEVNLLDDYIVDTLLDVATTGWNIVEREGISIRHPARFILIGSMNPEEGELRPQLLDRFGLVVNIEAPLDPETRAEIVRRVEEWQLDPESFYKKYEPEIEKLREKIRNARRILPEVEFDEDLLKILTKTIVELGIKTCRAEITTVRAAKAIAALDGRRKVTLEDLKKAMELTLPHRIKSRPFTQQEKPFRENTTKHNNINENNKIENKQQNIKERINTVNDSHRENTKLVSIDKDIEVKAKDVELSRSIARNAKQTSEYDTLSRSRRYRSRSIGTYDNGLKIYSIPIKDLYKNRIDIYETVRESILKTGKVVLPIPEYFLKTCVKSSRTKTLNIVLLDLSGSMNFMRRIAIAKGIVKRLAESSYVDKCYISLITFQKKNANIIIEPTKQIEVVYNLIDNLKSGGTTPLAEALLKALYLCRKWLRRDKNSRVNIHIITDGKCNIGIWEDPIKDSLEIIHRLLSMNISIIIYDTRPRNILDPAPNIIDRIMEMDSVNIRVVEV